MPPRGWRAFIRMPTAIFSQTTVISAIYGKFQCVLCAIGQCDYNIIRWHRFDFRPAKTMPINIQRVTTPLTIAFLSIIWKIHRTSISYI